MDEQTTIVGRPTYMAMFSGRHEPGPIVDALTASGYPQDDIVILLRPPGTDAALDLLSGENAAGQDTDVSRMIEAHPDKMQDACTIVILHPGADQVEAVRVAISGLGGQEFDYQPETRYSGADSEAEFERTTIGSVPAADLAAPPGAVPPQQE